jgi:hypothetical protein
MVHDLLADAVIVVHLAFVAFVALGGFLAWRWRWVWPVHLVAVGYGAGIVVVGWSCPLTDLERALREAGGGTAPTEGFVERWIEGVVYPGDLTPQVRVAAGVAIAVSWAVLVRRHRRQRDGAVGSRSATRRRASVVDG